MDANPSPAVNHFADESPLPTAYVAPPNSRSMAIDYGDRRIGLAISDPARLVVKGLATLDRKVNKNWLKDLIALVSQHHISEVVVGLPRNMDGSYGFAADKVEDFMDELEPLLPEDVVLHCLDERLTSVIAQQRLREQGKKPSMEKGLVDQEAACLLLEDFLRQQANK